MKIFQFITLLASLTLVTLVSGCSQPSQPSEQNTKWKIGDLAIIKISGQTGMVTHVWDRGCEIRVFTPNSKSSYAIVYFQWFEFSKTEKQNQSL